MKFLHRFAQHAQGNTTLIFALSFVAIIGAAGGALDFYNAFSARNNLQDALDSAVLAGVQAPDASRSTAASAMFLKNIPADQSGATQSYTAQTASASTSAGTVITTTLTGNARSTVSTYLLKLLGIDTLDLRATATASGDKLIATAGRPCIYVLDPSGNQALLVNSGASVTAPDCEIHVKSTANPAAIFNSGSSLNFKKLCIKGTNVIRNSVTVPNLELGCDAKSDPYAGTLPTPASSTCNYSNGNYNDSTISLSPGVYCGWFNFNNSSAKVTFAPGVYVIKNGGWNVNGGTWTGNGVTFYFADTSKIQFNSGIAADLAAPSSGTYKDLLMYEASGLAKTQFVLNDSVSNKLTGLIWLPSRELTLNAKSGIQSDALTLVTWRLILNNTTWKLTPQSGTSSGFTAVAAGKVRLTH